MLQIRCLVEGLTDETLVRRLFRDSSAKLNIEVAGGKQALEKKIPAYLATAEFVPTFLLADLDSDEACPSEYLRKRVALEKQLFCFRLAVRASEAWLIADRENFARYFGLRLADLPTSVDDIQNPKRLFLQKMSNSRKHGLRINILPRPGSAGTVGRGYTAELSQFIMNHWDTEIAAQSSPSLKRCLFAIRELTSRAERFLAGET